MSVTNTNQAVINIKKTFETTYFNISFNSTSQAFTADVANNGNAKTALGPTYTGGWAHVASVFSSSTSRVSYLNGVSGTENTETVVNPAGLNTMQIGSYEGIATTGGTIAEVGVYNVALNAAEIAALAKGMTCDKVRPQSLVFYAPLVRNLIDTKGGLTITNNNSATVADHPRIYG
jgi:hypothetical protein